MYQGLPEPGLLVVYLKKEKKSKRQLIGSLYFNPFPYNDQTAEYLACIILIPSKIVYIFGEG